MSTTLAPSAAATAPRRDPRIAERLGRRRKRWSLLIESLCVVAMLIGLGFLALILWTLLRLGVFGMALHVFTQSTKPPGSNGGLLNAIVGSIIQTSLGTAIGMPVGLMAGTYLAEYAGKTRLGEVVRFVSDVLLSAPSILIGLFVYTLLVEPFGGFSGLAGAIALALIVVPIVVRTTEDMLRLIPVSLREASAALGAPKWKTVMLVCYRAAREGIATGVLLAVARIAGETAPLLFTSLGNLNWSIDLRQPMASLPVTIYQYAGSAFDDWVQLAWTGALLITFGVLAINITARVLLRPRV
jgi:phosphate transport system permease protein